MHGVLVRSDSLTAAGGFDTELLSSLDCADLGLRLQGVDGSGWFEPGATLTYDASRPRPSDLPLYLGRWSRATVEHDIVRFAATWDLDLRDPRLDDHRGFLEERCMRAIPYARGGVRRAFGPAAVARLEQALDAVFDRFSDARGRVTRCRPGSTSTGDTGCGPEAQLAGGAVVVVVDAVVVVDDVVVDGGAVVGAGVVGGCSVVGTGTWSRRYGHAHEPVVA